MGFSIINHPFWNTPIYGNLHISSYIPNEGSLAKHISTKLRKASTFIFSVIMAFTCQGEWDPGTGKNCDVVLWMVERPRDSQSWAVLVNRLF